MSTKRTLDKAIKACDTTFTAECTSEMKSYANKKSSELKSKGIKVTTTPVNHGGDIFYKMVCTIPEDKVEAFIKSIPKQDFWMWDIPSALLNYKPKKEKMVPIEKGIIIKKSNESALKSILNKFGLKLLKDKRTEERADLWNRYDKSVYEAVLVKGKIPESKQNDFWYGDFPRYIAQEIW